MGIFKPIKISPISKPYPAMFRTFESSLAAGGYVRAPGTFISIAPHREADQRYRTGLDKTSMEFNRMSPEQQAEESKIIDSLLAKLKEKFGDSIDFADPRASIWNVFSNNEVKASLVKLGNGSLILNPEIDPQDLINYCWLRVHPKIAKSSEAYMRGECKQCQYYIEDAGSENKMLYQKKKEINKAIAKFEGLSATKQKQIARLLGLPVSDDSTEEQIYNMIDTLLKKPEFDGTQFRGLSPVTKFNEMFAISDDKLYIKDLIEQAIRYNIYRIQGDKVMEGGQNISTSKETLTDYFLDDKNQKELLALGKKIQAKALANTV